MQEIQNPLGAALAGEFGDAAQAVVEQSIRQCAERAEARSNGAEHEKTEHGEPAEGVTPGRDLAQRHTAQELIGVWMGCVRDIEAAFASIAAVEERLGDWFNGEEHVGEERHKYRAGFSVEVKGYEPWNDPKPTVRELELRVWRVLVDRLGIRQLLSLKKIQELDHQLSTGKDLPELTLENVLAMAGSARENVGTYIEEKIREVYNWLRPGGWQRTKYKTNEKSEKEGVGRKVIKTWACERKWGNGWTIGYSYQANFRAMDEVFHLLDGEKLEETWQGELLRAIEEQTKEGGNEAQTKYFRVKCFANQNVHIEFLRSDLLREFNLVAGGKRLRFDGQTV